MLDRLRTRQGRDAVLTLATEGLALLGMVWAYRLAAKKDVDGEVLGLYVIARRTVSFGFPVLLLGAAISLTRFAAMTSDAATRRRYLAAALSWVLPLGAITAALGYLLARPLSWAVFGLDDHTGLLPPLALMIVGIGLHGVAYAQLRGIGLTTIANAAQLMALAIAPCAAFLLFEGIDQVLWCTGIVWTVVSLIVITVLLLDRSLGKVGRERAELLRYGLPRVPGDVAMAALLTVPVYFAARTHGLSIGGQVGFGATLLNLAAAVFNPVALLLLPAAAAHLARGEHAKLSASIGRLSFIMTAAATALMLVFELLAGPLLHAYIGGTADQYIAISRLCFLGALPFGYFFGMRSVLDAYFQTPRNGVNLLKAFGILLFGGLLHLVVPTPAASMAAVMVIALWYLGWATWRDVRFVRRELERLATRDPGGLKVVAVIPDALGGVAYEGSMAQAKAMMDHGATVRFFHMESRTSPLALLGSRRRLKALLRAERPDVVHVHYGSMAGLWTVLSSPVPVVVTFLGDDLDRNEVPGLLRPRLGRIFSQLAAFFAAGLICADEQVRENLWWRANEARVIASQDPSQALATLEHLRSIGFHRSAADKA